MTTVLHEKVSVGELLDRFNALTEEKLNMSAETFMARCRAHTLDMTSPVVSKLALYARMLDEAKGSDNR